MQSFLKANYHPFLFLLITGAALAELGLTAYLVTMGNASGTWPSKRYHALLIMFLFNSSWTILFSVAYLVWMVDSNAQILASVASSVIWLLVTSTLWGLTTGIMYVTRTGTDCRKRDAISRCRQSLTVEALGWTEFALCILALMATCLWVCSSDGARKQKKRFGLRESQQRLVVSRNVV